MPTSSSLHDFSIVPEVTFGVTPANPAFVRKLITGTTLALSKGTIMSEVIRPDRQVQDQRPGNRQCAGDVAVELCWSDFDTMLEALFCGTWTPRLPIYTALTISAASGDNSINDSANLFPVFIPGEKIILAGFVAGGNNTTVTVVSRTAGKVVVSGVVLVTGAAGPSVSVTCVTNYVIGGIIRRSFSFLRNFADIVTGAGKLPYHLFKGVVMNTFNLTVAPEQLVKATFGIWAREMSLIDSLTGALTGATFTNASGNHAFDSFTGSVLVNAVAVANITELKLTIENNMESRFVLFDDRSLLPKVGKFKVSGSMNLFFDDSAFLTAFNGSVNQVLQFTLTDVNGHTYTFDIPLVLPTGGQADVQGDNDVHITFPFSALFDTTSGTSLKLTRSA